MKNDSSRDTFDARKHFSSVRMQQGRVQLDADWNEQSDIITHRVRTEAADIIGLCGGPLHDAAFHIVADLSQLTAKEQALSENKTPPTGFKAPDFLISAGRYYVHGILCDNEQLTSYLNQPDLPGVTLIKDAGFYLVYVDVWQRHLTALDDPAIREIALGGPDTATRTKTIWQVKYWFAGANTKGNCLTKFADFEKLIAAGDGKLSARTKQEQTSTSPCIVSPGAGYRGLENQLYRVEVHQDGAALDVTSGGAGTLATRVSNTNNQVKFSGGSWQAGQAIEIFSSKVGIDPMNGTLAYITKIDGGSKTLTLNLNVSDIALDELRLRPAKATYKWSRDNGVVVTTIENINGQEITVHDLGPDAVLGFKEGQWVEIIDDGLELNGLPGQLAQISKIDRAINLITLNFAPAPLAAQAGGIDKTLHPKLRGWDGIGAIKFHPKDSEDHFLDLEDGVQVRFFAGTFKSGNYWTIPARTATADKQSGNIEWPQDANSKPLAQLPFGIKHHYCRLAMLLWNDAKKIFDVVEDCRNLFPPVSELTSLFYVSGDGQEAMPDDPLPQLLQVGVFNGRWPVAGAQVRFVAQGNGLLAADSGGLMTSNKHTLTVGTGPDGIASCAWKLDPDVTKPSQQVEARLLDANGDPLPPIVRFNGNLSIADQVFYDPDQCRTLKGRKTVQKAIDQLADLVSLYEVSGNDQEVMPGAVLEPLQVLAASKCGPVKGQKVSFKVVAGGGTVNPAEIPTDASGFASTIWKPDTSTPSQQVEASLIDESAPSVAPPTSVLFTSNLSVASQVAYQPSSQCPDLANAATVQQALDELCKRTPQAESGIRITDILTNEAGSRRPLLNDSLVPVSRLANGITIVCDGPVVRESVGASPDPPPSQFPEAVAGKPTCFVTLDLPHPLGSDRDFWGVTEIVGFQPLILGCSVSVKEKEIHWSPTSGANRWLQDILLERLSKNRISDRVLAHLTLKGNFIWSQDSARDSALYLDAEAFGLLNPRSKRINLSLPTGDGRKGGNFEMWFWLVEQSSNPAPGLILDAVASSNAIRGSVRDTSGAAVSSVQVTLMATATGEKTTAATDAQGRFVFSNVTFGTYQVSVQVGGLSEQKTVNVER